MEVTYSEEELEAVARQLINAYSGIAIWLFNGEMGAGKTTLIKAICKEWKVIDEMSSPTFSIVNDYATETDEVVHHFDFYRLESIEEAIDIGVEDYFFSGSRCMIEWADLIMGLLPDKYLKISINLVDQKCRYLTTFMHE